MLSTDELVVVGSAGRDRADWPTSFWPLDHLARWRACLSDPELLMPRVRHEDSPPSPGTVFILEKRLPAESASDAEPGFVRLVRAGSTPS